MRRPTPAAQQLRRDPPVRDVAQQGVAPFPSGNLVQNGQRSGKRPHACVAGRFDVLQHEEVGKSPGLVVEEPEAIAAAMSMMPPPE